MLIALAVIAALFLALMAAFPERAAMMGQSGAWLAFIQTALVGMLVAAGFGGGRRAEGAGRMVAYGAVWIGIALFLVAAYSQRAGFESLWRGMTGALVPHAPQETASGSLTIRQAADGHYWTRLTLNGVPVMAMVDTGASELALSRADARRIGIDDAVLDYSIPVSTAAGPSRAALVRLDTVRIGPLTTDGVRALVMQDEGSEVTLAGMSLIGRFREVRTRDGVMELVP